MSRIRARFAGYGRPAWRRNFAAIAALLAALFGPAIANSQPASTDSLTLSWTAPGDDATVGTAAMYDMKYSLAPITLANWDQSPSVAGLPAPIASGQRQNFVLRGLSRDTTYYVALRTQDDAGNWSDVSNVLRWDWTLDTAPPSAPAGVAALKENTNVRVSWAANSEPDLAGYYVYRASSASGPFSMITGSLVSGATQYLDSNVPPAVTTVWYRVSAEDLNQNESAMSATVQVDVSTGGGVTADWTMSPGYPNPSRSGQPVCVPLVIPAGGAGEAVIEVVNVAGLRIRRFFVSSAPSCVGGVEWDGKNDAGREVAPGVYRAWLVVNDHRDAIKLVRQP
jgi:hypothetical protein